MQVPVASELVTIFLFKSLMSLGNTINVRELQQDAPPEQFLDPEAYLSSSRGHWSSC